MNCLLRMGEEDSFKAQHFSLLSLACLSPFKGGGWLSIPVSLNIVGFHHFFPPLNYSLAASEVFFGRREENFETAEYIFGRLLHTQARDSCVTRRRVGLFDAQHLQSEKHIFPSSSNLLRSSSLCIIRRAALIIVSVGHKI